MRILPILALALSLNFYVVAQVRDFQTLNFAKADSIAALYPNHSLKNLNLLSYKLTHSLSTDAEKFRAIYKWVCENIENNYDLFTRNQRNRAKLKDPAARKEWNTKMTGHVFKTLLEKHSTVCTGYAYLIRELAFHADIQAMIVDGFGRTIQANIGGEGIINHSWNAVKLNNKWYLCDATWSSGAMDMANSNFIKKYDNAYFLASPELFIRNHYPADTSWMLLKARPSLKTFLNRPIIYSSIYRYEITDLYPDAFKITTQDKKIMIQFRAPSTQPLGKITLKIGSSPGVISPIVEINNDLYTIEHQFKSKGNYVVHATMDDNPIFTYTVSVK